LKLDSFKLSKFVPVVMLVFSAASAYAQTPPDAGTLRQQIERDPRTKIPQPQPVKPEEPELFTPPSDITVTVESFRFAGNTLLSAEQLAPAIQPFIGRALSFNELQQAVQAVAKTYRDAGWIVRTYLPQQDVTDGVVIIQVVEAVFSGVHFEGTEPERVSSTQLLSYFDTQQDIGGPVYARTIDRTLLLMDDLPGVTVLGSLHKGEQQGETELAIQAIDEPIFNGELGADNFGSHSTGDDRQWLSANLNSPTGRGDLLQANIIHSKGSDYGRLAYSLPLGVDGLRFGVNGSRFKYELVDSAFSALDANGSSNSAGLDVSYPILRSKQRNLYASLAYDYRSFLNKAGGVVQSDYHSNSATLSLFGNLFDSFGGGGANAIELAWVSGDIDQGRLDSGENQLLEGGYDKFRYAISRQQVLTNKLSLFAELAGQYSSQTLDSSERAVIGGRYGVRAYPSGEGSGTRSDLANVELRWRARSNVVMTAFYDVGHVSNINAEPSYSLKGYGLGTDITLAYGMVLQALWSHRDGNNPNPAADGRDQDGTLDRNRIWLSLSLPLTL